MREVRITKELFRKIQTRSAASGLLDPVAAIIEGHWEGDCQISYHLAFYEREQIPKNEPVEIVSADGIELLIVQSEVLAKLATGKLRLRDGAIVIAE